MPRRSLAEQIYQETENITEEPETSWLILYDFHEVKPNTRFWINIKRLTTHDPCSTLIQYSALKTGSKRVASATRRLVEHYGGAARVFRVENVEI
jgi:hypothetical protein